MVRWSSEGVTGDARDHHRSVQESDRLVAVEFGNCPSNAGTEVLRGAGERLESEFQCSNCITVIGTMGADAVLYQSELRSQGVDGVCG